MSEDRILLVLPLPIYRAGDQYFIETQAANNLGLWLDNFQHVTLMGPEVALSEPRPDTSNIETVKGRNRLAIFPVPAAWVPLKFLKALPCTARLLDEQIRRADYLHFAIGGLWGDWAAVASFIARRLKLPYAVWTDRVESKVAVFSNLSRRGLKKLYHSINIAIMTVLEKNVIRGSSLGLFHGQDCFDAYEKFSSNPHVVHDIATGHSDLISKSDLLNRLSQHEELRIAYAGRAHREKGVFDWIDTLTNLTFPFRATWFGDGPEIDTARELIRSLALNDKIRFPGAVSHREVLHQLKSFDVFLFCHKTPESPRCLIEALQCGLPIVGYESPYPRMLAAHGAGFLSKQGDISKLARTLSDINSNRASLKSSSEAAVIEGTKYSAETVFAHRAELMRTIPARSKSNQC